jgi:hypothetical protein
MKITTTTKTHVKTINIKLARCFFCLLLALEFTLVALKYFDVIDIKKSTLHGLDSFMLIFAVWDILGRSLFKTRKVAIDSRSTIEEK